MSTVIKFMTTSDKLSQLITSLLPTLKKFIIIIESSFIYIPSTKKTIFRYFST